MTTETETINLQEYAYVAPTNGTNHGVVVWSCPDFFWKVHYHAETGEYLGQLQDNIYYGEHPEEPRTRWLAAEHDSAGRPTVNDKIVEPLSAEILAAIKSRRQG